MNQPPELSRFNMLVWDLDGTILDSFKISLKIWTKVLEERGRQLDPIVLQENYYGTLEETAQAVLVEEVSEQYISSMVADFRTEDNAFMQAADVNSHLFADAVGLIKRANGLGHRQVIVTNRAHGVDRGNASPRTLINNSHLKDCISEIICSDDVENRKPHPLALNGVQYNPESTLVIGDQHIDGDFARSLGATAILVNRVPGSSLDVARLDVNHTIVDSLDGIN